jgi:hypothetical protein
MKPFIPPLIVAEWPRNKQQVMRRRSGYVQRREHNQYQNFSYPFTVDAVGGFL